MHTQECEVQCPFCCEYFTIVVDPSVVHQQYVEDCFVCCRPITFSVSSQEMEVTSIDASR